MQTCPNYHGYTVIELQEEARRHNLSGVRKLKKPALVRLLEENYCERRRKQSVQFRYFRRRIGVVNMSSSTSVSAAATRLSCSSTDMSETVQSAYTADTPPADAADWSALSLDVKDPFESFVFPPPCEIETPQLPLAQQPFVFMEQVDDDNDSAWWDVDSVFA